MQENNNSHSRLRRAHLATLKNPERDVLEVAEELGNMLLREDFGMEKLSGVVASLMNRLKTPEAIAAPDFGTFENVGHSIDQLLTPELLPKLQVMLGTPTQSKVKIGYIAGPTMLEKYGPALVALQKLYGPQTRIVVVIQGSPEIREAQMKIANALNKDLPAEQQILVRENPHSAAAILKNRYQIQGLGVSRTDADLLRQILDFNLSQSQNFVNNFVSSMPGLSALLAEWNVAFHHLLESAA